jgi:hypothetical protein
MPRTAQPPTRCSEFLLELFEIALSGLSLELIRAHLFGFLAAYADPSDALSGTSQELKARGGQLAPHVARLTTTFAATATF